jgi:hypothetical protein
MPQDDSDILRTTVAKLRNILFVSLLGLLVFAGIAIALHTQESRPPPGDDVLT